MLPRIYGTMSSAAPDAESARAVVDRAEATLGPDEQCPFCAIMLAVPAAQACAAAAELFDSFGQPLDAARCRTSARPTFVPSPRRPPLSCIPAPH